MKMETKEFILNLLLRELEEEYIYDNEKPLEVEYVKDLIEASIDFAKSVKFEVPNWIYRYLVKDKINQLLENEERT